MSNPKVTRVLIVDDERFMRKTVKSMLRTISRFICEEAADGAAALDAAAIFKPDLVICDIGMTPMSGLEFVEKLRNHANKALRHTRVIMLTVEAQETTVLDAARLQVDGYLVKPVSPKQLGDRLRTLFDIPPSARTGA